MSARKGPRAVLYARYSTDKQSESSIEDQFRVSSRRTCATRIEHCSRDSESQQIMW
jgi:hypothetical protein